MGDQLLRVTQVGDLPVRVKMVSQLGNVTYPRLLFKDVFVVLSSETTILSVKHAVLNGFSAHFSSDPAKEGFFLEDNSFVPFFQRQNGLCYLAVSFEKGLKVHDRVILSVPVNGNYRAVSSIPAAVIDVPSSSDDDEPPELLNADASDGDSEDEGVPSLCGSDTKSDSDIEIVDVDTDDDASAAGAPSAKQRAAKKRAAERRAQQEEYYIKIATFWHEVGAHQPCVPLRHLHNC